VITFSTIKSSLIAQGQRILTLIQYGVKTANECAPFGDDSCPPANLTAIYAETSNAGDQVVLGYINLDQQAQPGEKRLYSLQPDGSLSFYAWLRYDGTMSLGGEDNNLVRYAALNEGIEAKDEKINAELAKIEVAIAALGGTYAMETVSTDISESKINEIKCI
jgi:hypothetical protein